MTTAGAPGNIGRTRAVLDGLAERLQRSVVLNDPLVRYVYASRHFDDADDVRIRAILQHDAGADVVAYVLEHGVETWSGPGRLAPAPEFGLHGRWCAPLRAGGRFLGTVMIIDARDDLTDAERAAIERAAATVADDLHAHALSTDAARGERDALIRDLFSPDVSRRENAGARLGGLGFPDRPRLVVALIHIDTAAHTSARVELALRDIQTSWENFGRLPALCAVDHDRAELLQHWHSDPQPEHLRADADRIRDTLRRTLGAGARCTIGIADPTTSITGLADARRQAAIALRAARLLGWTDGIGLWSALGAYAPLLGLADAVPPGSTGARAVAALRAHDAGPRLLETLRVYLDHAGSAPASAKALNLHRTSLYYRLGQIQDITGLDLDSGADRLALHIQLHLDEIDGRRTIH